jgi:hypothetical protein
MSARDTVTRLRHEGPGNRGSIAVRDSCLSHCVQIMPQANPAFSGIRNLDSVWGVKLLHRVRMLEAMLSLLCSSVRRGAELSTMPSSNLPSTSQKTDVEISS